MVSPFQLIEGKLIKGRDYAIKKHQTEKEHAAKPIQRKERIHKTDTHGMTIGDLNYQLPGGQLSAKVLEIHTKCERKTHAGEELLFCLTGKVGVEISNVKAVLNKGDAIFFWGTEPHCYFNADKGKSVSVALSVVKHE